MGKKRALAVWESDDAPRRPRGKKRADDDSETLNEKRAELPVDYKVERISEQASKEQEREEIYRIGCALITLILIMLTFAGAPAKEWFPS